jgi:hypothetical protein
LIEVAECFDRPEILAAVKYDRHVAGAIAESLRMSGSARSFELREALALAARQSAIFRTFTRVAGRAAGRLSRVSGTRRADPGLAFASGQVISLGGDVRNIFDAASAISRLISTRQHIT